MNEPRTGAGRALVDGVSKASPGVGLMVRDNVAAAEAEAVAAYRAYLREKVEGLNWFEPGSDGCEAHQDNWDWGPDRWAHLSRAAVLALIDEPG